MLVPPVPTTSCQDDTLADDDDDDPQTRPAAAISTKNEITNPPVSLPEVKEVDPSEPIEKIGEIQSIIDSVVIIRGMGSPALSVPVEKVLDSESLLVFEDRKVLGSVGSFTCCTSFNLLKVLLGL